MIQKKLATSKQKYRKTEILGTFILVFHERGEIEQDRRLLNYLFIYLFSINKFLSSVC